LLHGDAVLPDADASQHLIAKLPRGSTAADHKIPRFDRRMRNGKVERLHQESVASILGLSGFDQRPSLFEVVAGIRKAATLLKRALDLRAPIFKNR